jgi:hypothetical protein
MTADIYVADWAVYVGALGIACIGVSLVAMIGLLIHAFIEDYRASAREAASVAEREAPAVQWFDRRRPNGGRW